MTFQRYTIGLLILILTACSNANNPQDRKTERHQADINKLYQYFAKKNISKNEVDKIVTECNLSGGIMHSGGVNGDYYCFIYYDDAGKSCQSKEDCQGQCLLGINEPISKAQCAEANITYGCYTIIENGKEVFSGCAD